MKLVVKVVGCRGTSLHSAYISLAVGNRGQLQRTKVSCGNQDEPVFNEEFLFNHCNENDNVCLLVFDTESTCHFEAGVPVSSIMGSATDERWVPLQPLRGRTPRAESTAAIACAFLLDPPELPPNINKEGEPHGSTTITSREYINTTPLSWKAHQLNKQRGTLQERLSQLQSKINHSTANIEVLESRLVGTSSASSQRRSCSTSPPPLAAYNRYGSGSSRSEYSGRPHSLPRHRTLAADVLSRLRSRSASSSPETISSLNSIAMGSTSYSPRLPHFQPHILQPPAATKISPCLSSDSSEGSSPDWALDWERQLLEASSWVDQRIASNSPTPVANPSNNSNSSPQEMCLSPPPPKSCQNSRDPTTPPRDPNIDDSIPFPSPAFMRSDVSSVVYPSPELLQWHQMVDRLRLEAMAWKTLGVSYMKAHSALMRRVKGKVWGIFSDRVSPASERSPEYPFAHHSTTPVSVTPVIQAEDWERSCIVSLEETCWKTIEDLWINATNMVTRLGARFMHVSDDEYSRSSGHTKDIHIRDDDTSTEKSESPRPQHTSNLSINRNNDEQDGYTININTTPTQQPQYSNHTPLETSSATLSTSTPPSLWSATAQGKPEMVSPLQQRRTPTKSSPTRPLPISNNKLSEEVETVTTSTITSTTTSTTHISTSSASPSPASSPSHSPSPSADHTSSGNTSARKHVTINPEEEPKQKQGNSNMAEMSSPTTGLPALFVGTGSHFESSPYNKRLPTSPRGSHPTSPFLRSPLMLSKLSSPLGEGIQRTPTTHLSGFTTVPYMPSPLLGVDMAGWLKKKKTVVSTAKAKEWTRKYFVLRDSTLKYYMSPDEARKDGECNGVLDVRHARIFGSKDKREIYLVGVRKLRLTGHKQEGPQKGREYELKCEELDIYVSWLEKLVTATQWEGTPTACNPEIAL